MKYLSYMAQVLYAKWAEVWKKGSGMIIIEKHGI
jgi:hypothetical protein